MNMSWLSNIFVKKKTLDEVRTWVAQSKSAEVDTLRAVLVKIDACALDRSEKQGEIDRLTSIKVSLQEQHSKIVQEKESFVATSEYQALKNQIGSVIKLRKAIEAELAQVFEPVKGVIGQYAQIVNDPKLNLYAGDYVDALIHDYDVSIARQVPLIIGAIEQGKFSASNPQEVIGLLNQLKTERLSKFVHSYAAAKKNEAEVKASLCTNELLRQHEHFLQSLGEVQKEIDALDVQIAQVVLPSDEEFRKELAMFLLSHRVQLV